jgi:hypothetical protein
MPEELFSTTSMTLHVASRASKRKRHGVPFVSPTIAYDPKVQTAGLEHVPVDGSHVPATWHWSEAVQTTGFEPTHVPF